MEKKEIAKLAIGTLGLMYVGAGALDPDNKDIYEEYADGASEAISNIPVTLMQEFILVAEDGSHIITRDGDQIIGREKVSYEMDLRGGPEIAIVSTLKNS